MSSVHEMETQKPGSVIKDEPCGGSGPLVPHLVSMPFDDSYTPGHFNILLITASSLPLCHTSYDVLQELEDSDDVLITADVVCCHHLLLPNFRMLVTSCLLKYNFTMFHTRRWYTHYGIVSHIPVVLFLVTTVFYLIYVRYHDHDPDLLMRVQTVDATTTGTVERVTGELVLFLYFLTFTLCLPRVYAGIFRWVHLTYTRYRSRKFPKVVPDYLPIIGNSGHLSNDCIFFDSVGYGEAHSIETMVTPKSGYTATLNEVQSLSELGGRDRNCYGVSTTISKLYTSSSNGLFPVGNLLYVFYSKYILGLTHVPGCVISHCVKLQPNRTIVICNLLISAAGSHQRLEIIHWMTSTLSNSNRPVLLLCDLDLDTITYETERTLLLNSGFSTRSVNMCNSQSDTHSTRDRYRRVSSFSRPSNPVHSTTIWYRHLDIFFDPVIKRQSIHSNSFLSTVTVTCSPKPPESIDTYR